MTSSDNGSVSPESAASVTAPSVGIPAQAPAAVGVDSSLAHPGFAPPARTNTGLVVAGVVGVALLGMLALGVVVYLIAGLGGDAFALGGIMAFIPLVIVFLGARWIDRWEPEPRLAIVFAFLWGAAVAVIIALVVGATVDNVINALGGPGSGYDFFSAAIQAPVVEEGGKGLGLLILFLVARKYFDGPVDGVVYAAWVAGGFAFTENILYFGGTLLEEGGVDSAVFELFLIRGIMSPFAHVMFTACTGIALGFAARRTNAFGAVGFFFLGLIPAMLLHALWNGALFFVDNFYGYYAIVQFPLFVVAVGLVVYLRRQELGVIRGRLTEYAEAGWFHPDEITALATPAGRRQSIDWAKQHGIGKTMKRYIADATHLAFVRQRVVSGRAGIGAAADEAALLAAIVAGRAALRAPAAGSVGVSAPTA